MGICTECRNCEFCITIVNSSAVSCANEKAKTVVLDLSVVGCDDWPKYFEPELIILCNYFKEKNNELK